MRWLNQVADWFDDNRRWGDAYLDNTFQGWINSTEDPSSWTSSGLGYAVTVGGTGVLYAVWHLSTTVASGFVDVARMGDGTYDWATGQGSAWGIGQDALRLLMVAGPALRMARYGVALVAEVDEFSNMGNCTWVAATRALRMTGVKHYATLGDLMSASGLTAPAEMGGAFADEMVPALRFLGADARVVVEAADSMEGVVKAANANPNGVIMFSVEWTPPGTAQSVGHTLLAQRQLFGGVKLLDRSGKVLFDSLTQVEAVGYEGISTARVYGPAVAVQNARAVQLLGVAPTLANSLAVEVKSVVVPNPYEQNYTPAAGVCR
jgi:hypothetical protein